MHNVSKRRISNATRKKNKASFIEKAKKRFNNLYDYSKVRYSCSTRIVTIICPKHGDFKQTPANHLNGTGCPYCSYGRLSDQEFVAQVAEEYGNNYDLSNSGYSYQKYPSQKISVFCKKHKVSFIKRADSFLKGQGCRLCKNKKQSDVSIFPIDQNKKINGRSTIQILVDDVELLNADIMVKANNSFGNGTQVKQVAV